MTHRKSIWFRYRFVGVLIVIALIIIVVRQQVQRYNNEHYLELIAQAQTLLNDKKYVETLGVCEKAKTLAESRFEAYQCLSSIYTSKKNYDSVVETWEKALKKSSDKQKIYLELGKAYLLNNKISQAENTFSKLKDSPTKEVYLSYTQELQGKSNSLPSLTVTEAKMTTDFPITELVKLKIAHLMETALDSSETTALRGDLTEIKDQSQNYLATSDQELLQKMILAQNDIQYERLLQAQLLIQFQFYPLSLKLLQTVIGQAPSYRDAYLTRGAIYEAVGDLSKAEIDYNKALEIDPTNGDTHLLLSKLRWQQQKTSEASQEADKALYLEKNRIDFYEWAAFLSFSQNDCQKGLTDLESAYITLAGWQDKKTNAISQSLLGEKYLQCEAMDKAYSLAVQLQKNQYFTNNPEIQNFYYWSLWKNGQKVETALSNYAKLTETFPNFAAGYERYAQLLTIAGEEEKAMEMKNRAMELE